MWAADGTPGPSDFLPAAAVILFAMGCGGSPDGGRVESAERADRDGADPVVPYPESGDSLPGGVTREMVVRGRQVYRDQGLCYSCHGMKGRGAPRAGASLRDAEWYHADGSYESLVRWVANGVTAEASHSGMRMPPRGGAKLTSNEVRAVAAWVWWFSRPPNRPSG